MLKRISGVIAVAGMVAAIAAGTVATEASADSGAGGVTQGPTYHTDGNIMGN